MGLLGKSKKEAWAEFANAMGAEVIDCGSLKGGIKVKLEYSFFDIVLDNYTVSTGKSSITYTRVRAVYVSGDEFKFKIFKTNIFTKLAKLFGKQFVLTGDNDFDSEFTIRSDQYLLIEEIFQNSRIKEMLKEIKKVNFFVKGAKGKKETKGISNEMELQYIATGVIKDVSQLTYIFGVMVNLLDEFVLKEIAKKEKPQIKYI